MTSPHVEEPAKDTAPALRRAPSSGVVVRATLLVLLIIVSFVAVEVFGLPDTASLRAQVDGTGFLGWLVFVAGYAVITLVPAPKAVLTALGGAVFGLWLGAALALTGALIGAVVAFGVGRWLGRDAVNRLARGRLAKADEQLSNHGFTAVVTARLIPVLPFTLINYTAGVSGVRLRDFITGSAIGMVPGSLAYAAVGAYGSDPFGLFVAGAALVLLVLVGGLFGRWLRARNRGSGAGA